jgi:AI-2 transport protein TqsA
MDSESLNRGRSMPALLVTASLVITVTGLRAAADILVPVTFAGFLTVLLAPLVRSLRRLHVPTALAVPLVVLACVALLSLLFTAVGQSLNALVAEAPRYQERFFVLTRQALGWLHDHGFDVSQERLLNTMRSERGLSLLGQAVSQVASLLSNLLLVVLLVLFLLFDAVELPARMAKIGGGTRFDLTRFRQISDEVKQYLVLKTYLCLLTGGIVWIVLAVTGIDFAPLWALIAVMLGYIPNIGPFIGSAPPVVLALLQVGPGRMAIVLLLLSTVHMIIGNVVEPQVLGRKLGLSASAVFLALILWGWIWGVAGMLLSVPLMVIAKILLENSSQYGHWASLLEPTSGPLPTLSHEPILGNDATSSKNETGPVE